MEGQIVICRKCGKVEIYNKIQYKTTKDKKCKQCPKCGNSQSKHLRYTNDAAKHLNIFGPEEFINEIDFQKSLVNNPGFDFINPKGGK